MPDTNEPHRRIPYESEDRLQDETQKQNVSAILGLEDDLLTNSKPLPLPEMAGAGRVKKFRNETQGNNVASSSGGQGAGPRALEAGVSSPVPSLRHHPGGYPSLASFIGSDKDFFIFRRFSTLSARNLLYLQDELLELETRLRDIDLKESLRGTQQDLWNLHSRREDSNQARKTLMKEIRIKLQEYTNAVQSQASMLALEPAPSIHVDSIANWVDGSKPTTEPESHFLDDKEDLMSLSGGHASKELLEQYLERRWYHFFRVKGKEDPRLSSTVEYYSTGRIKHIARILLAFVAAILAILPIPVLVYFTSGLARVIIVSIFAVVFTAVFSVMTNGRTPEIFASMAAYVAFLSVFISNT